MSIVPLLTISQSILIDMPWPWKRLPAFLMKFFQIFLIKKFFDRSYVSPLEVFLVVSKRTRLTFQLNHQFDICKIILIVLYDWQDSVGSA